ncbi:MAG: alpha/beta fold hydrolase [Candidatus Binatia bacterium]
MHYIDGGSGPLLLTLHGNPTWSYLYRHLIHGPKDGFRCVAVDHLGFGLSDKPQVADYTIAGHTARLTEFADALELRDSHRFLPVDSGSHRLRVRATALNEKPP